MTVRNLWEPSRALLTASIDALCEVRDAHRGKAWERLSVAYPDPREALAALELFRAARLQLAAV